MFHKDDRTALFIDGPNFFGTSRGLDMDVDYRKLLDYFRDRCRLIRAHYYTPIYPNQEDSPLRAITNWLDYNGYQVIAKRPREYFNEGRRKVKNDMEIELVVDILESSEHLDHIVLFSGNGDYLRMVTALQRRGKIVSIVSTLQTETPMVSDELRRHADNFIELEGLREHIHREWKDESDSDVPDEAYDHDNE